MNDFVAIVHKDPTCDFGVSFPDFPGCTSAGANLGEAAAQAAAALSGHIAPLNDEGRAVPEPTSLEPVMTDAGIQDGVPILIPAPIRRSVRAVGLNITVPADVLARVDAQRRAKA